MFMLGFLIGFFVFLILILSLSCYFVVQEGYVGVLSTFGAVHFKNKQTLITYSAGIHFKWPWQKLHVINKMEQNIALKEDGLDASVIASDGTLLRIESILRLTPHPDFLAEYLLGIESPKEHLSSLFNCLVRSEIANFGWASKKENHVYLESFLSKDSMSLITPHSAYAVIKKQRIQLNQAIAQRCAQYIQTKYGVEFQSVDLINILPPDELVNALNAVLQSQNQMEALYAHTQSECEQKVLSAQHAVTIATHQADAIAIEIEQLGAYLQTLKHQGTLSAYIDRRKNEVLSASKTLFYKNSQSIVK